MLKPGFNQSFSGFIPTNTDRCIGQINITNNLNFLILISQDIKYSLIFCWKTGHLLWVWTELDLVDLSFLDEFELFEQEYVLKVRNRIELDYTFVIRCAK